MSKNTASEIPATGLPSRRRPTHPGVVLLELFLREIPMSQAEAARRMNMPVTRVNELVRGRRGVTARSALRLGRLLGTTPMFWMNLQARWDLWHAQQDERQPLRPPAAPSPDDDRDHGPVDRQ
ncbi:MAG: HigA family addiction module antitoxin [Acidobacteria bacterium]|nr:HigA family addiction module antitoxin [Acidobacteriota bacterium]